MSEARLRATARNDDTYDSFDESCFSNSQKQVEIADENMLFIDSLNVFELNLSAENIELNVTKFELDST